MKKYLRFYRWGMRVKLHMAIYTAALLMLKCVVGLIQRERSVEMLVMLEMLLVSFAVAIAERLCFPLSKDLSAGGMKARTFIWAACAHAAFIGFSVGFGWFAGLPGWVYLLLILFLEFVLIAMWVGINLAEKLDTSELNSGLKDYQSRART